jgi:protein OPY2
VSLIPRQDECVPCPTMAPSCPSCPDGQICQIISQNCTQCAQSLCVDSSSVGEPGSSPSGPNTGAIAGGIAGALVVVIGCLVGVFSWYIRKKKRAAQDLDIWLDKSAHSTEDEEKESRRHTGSTTQHPNVFPSIQLL